MTTDLRAALRDAAALLRDDAQDHIDDARKMAAAPLLQMAERIEALSDAPPTVAELLASLPEPAGGRGPGSHRVEWEHDDMRIRALRYGLAGLIVERRLDGEWSRTNLNHADLNQPARLVEVA